MSKVSIFIVGFAKVLWGVLGTAGGGAMFNIQLYIERETNAYICLLNK